MSFEHFSCNHCTEFIVKIIRKIESSDLFLYLNLTKQMAAYRMANGQLLCHFLYFYANESRKQAELKTSTASLQCEREYYVFERNERILQGMRRRAELC